MNKEKMLKITKCGILSLVFLLMGAVLYMLGKTEGLKAFIGEGGWYFVFHIIRIIFIFVPFIALLFLKYKKVAACLVLILCCLSYCNFYISYPVYDGNIFIFILIILVIAVYNISILLAKHKEKKETHFFVWLTLVLWIIWAINGLIHIAN